jgi:hypothetical protein
MFITDALLFLMVAGSVAGLLAGATLVMCPSWLLRTSKRANRWISTRRIDRMLEQVVKVDRWFYRHHRVSGTLLLAGAIFLIYFFTTRFDKLGILVGLSKALLASPSFTEALLDAMVLSILLGAVFALIVSLFLLSRPSMLRGFEQGANKRISLNRALKPLAITRIGVDEYVFQNVQLAGALLLLGSLYILAGATFWLG